MPGHTEELLNVYDETGKVIGAQPRRQAKASGLAVGAVNALVLNGRGQVLLQLRPGDKENGGRWDKSVGGHVSAGEAFDTTVLREAAEELFDDPRSPRVRLAASETEFEEWMGSVDLGETVLLRRIGFQLNLRDVRHARGGGLRNVLYHIAIYGGRTEMPRRRFRPQAAEIADLAWFGATEVDRMLARAELAPNMAFLWLSQGHALLKGVPHRTR